MNELSPDGLKTLASRWLAAKEGPDRKTLLAEMARALRARPGLVAMRTDHELAEVMAEAAAAPDDAAAEAEVERLAWRLRPVADWAGEPLPEVLAQRDHDGPRPDAVLRAGELALLSAAGGTGKSYASLAWARAMAAGGGPACGLRMAAGPVVVLSYEDSPQVLAYRLGRMGGGPEALYCLPWPGQLWDAEARGPGESWRGLWAAIGEVGARLVIVDPASAALAGGTNDSGSVRPFLDSLRREAERLGLGVLVVAHDNKGARMAAARGEVVGADAVAGSSAWYDAARSVLYLRRGPDDGRLLQVLKSNYGRSGWGCELAEAEDAGGRFAGFELARRMTAAEVEAQLANWAQAAKDRAKRAKTKGRGASREAAAPAPAAEVDEDDWLKWAGRPEDD